MSRVSDTWGPHSCVTFQVTCTDFWVETALYVRLTSSKVTSFIISHIICRYGVPHELISDKGVHFRADVDTLLQRYGAKPYSLVYGIEVVLLVEIEMGSLRRKMAHAKRVKPRLLQRDYLVLKVIRGLIRDPRGKELTPKGVAWLMDLDGNRFSKPTNVDQLENLHYISCLKTTLRPWDQMSSLTALTLTGLWIWMTGIAHLMMDDPILSDFLIYHTSNAILGHISLLVEIYRSSWSRMILITYEMHVELMVYCYLIMIP
ncbi:hypothetical protein AAG906_030878 [Vitis piasezkii]